MDNQRFILYVGLALVLYLIWNAWQREQLPEQALAPAPATTSQVEESWQNDIPKSAGIASAETSAGKEKTLVNTVSSKRVTVETDVFNIEINTRGADIHYAELKTYPVSINEPDNPLVLLDNKTKTYITQSGLVHEPVANKDKGNLAPNHHHIYSADNSQYILTEGQDKLIVPFRWQGPNNVTVTKTFTFERGSFLVNVDYLIENSSTESWVGSQYKQLRHSYVSGERSWLRLPTYTGAAYYDQKYEKLSFDDMQKEPLNKEVSGGWVAMLQHYFFSAWLTEEFETNHYYSKIVEKDVGDDYIIGISSQAIRVRPNEEATFVNRLYLGPKLQKQIEKIQPSLELTTDYGMFTPLCKPLFWLLDFIHGWVKNWGVAIILVTMLIKLVFYRLSAASYRSMAKMRKVQPRFQALRERYADDKQKLNQAMWEMYRQEKINPIGGCLPILIQMPVFLSLYWVLIESVEMRQAPFMLWIYDLSTKDPYYILPLLMGITMFIQFRLNPRPPDPMQEKIFMVMPIFMTAFMAFFPAGLVLYWFVNNLLSIAQQWVITKRFEKA